MNTKLKADADTERERERMGQREREKEWDREILMERNSNRERDSVRGISNSAGGSIERRRSGTWNRNPRRRFRPVENYVDNVSIAGVLRTENLEEIPWMNGNIFWCFNVFRKRGFCFSFLRIA